MPFVHVHWREGRTPEQKSKVAERISEAIVEETGVAPEQVWVKFSDSPPENFIVGEPADE